MSIKYSVFLAALLALTGSLIFCSDGQGEYVYQDPEQRFAITMLNGWQAQPPNDHHALVAKPTASSLRGASVRVQVTPVEAGDNANVAAAKQVDQHLRGLKARSFDFKLLERARVSRDRGVYDHLSFAYSTASTLMRGEAWITIHKGQAYTLTLVVPQSVWASTAADLKRMAASFSVRF